MISAALLGELRQAAQAAAASDPAHDWLHVVRVEQLARTIAAAEGARIDLVSAAAILHELFSFPKNHPDSARSGERCATVADRLVVTNGVSDEDRRLVVACIRDHPYSAGVTPSFLEARVLQDADRLDAIGAIGVARCFAVCAATGRPFYDQADPFGRRRALDDGRFGLDHFYRKLLRISSGLHTATARSLATERHRFLELFLEELRRELD